MTVSRARLRVGRNADGRTRALTAHATSPQRWTVTQTAAGSLEAVHQVLGDGCFGGDHHRTAVTAAPGASLTVRSVAATPLRGPGASSTAVWLRAGDGARLIYVPGAMIPQAQANHTAALRITLAPSARVLAASLVAPGRTGMGEHGAFARLRLRTTLRSGAGTVFAEDAVIEPARVRLAGAAMFGGAQVALAVLAAGDWAPADPSWWSGRSSPESGVIGGAGALAVEAVCYRALCRTLGDAERFLRDLEAAACAVH